MYFSSLNLQFCVFVYFLKKEDTDVLPDLPDANAQSQHPVNVPQVIDLSQAKKDKSTKDRTSSIWFSVVYYSH